MFAHFGMEADIQTLAAVTHNTLSLVEGALGGVLTLLDPGCSTSEEEKFEVIKSIKLIREVLDYQKVKALKLCKSSVTTELETPEDFETYKNSERAPKEKS